MTKKQLIVGCTGSLISIIITFVMLEFGLRLYQDKNNTRTTILWHDDALVGRRLNPSQKGLFVSNTHEYKTEIEVNSQGFRDTEHTESMSAFRVLLLGDSFVENFQVPLKDSIFKKLEQNLTEKLGKPVEVIALGLGDSGTAQQYLLLKNIGLTYKPNLVVQLFFSGNDVKNNSLALMGDPYRPYFTIDNGELTSQSFRLRENSLPHRIVNFLKDHFRIVEFLLNAKGKLINKSIGLPIDYEVYRKSPIESYQKSWQVTEKLLVEEKKITEESGASFMLVSLANNEQVNNDVQKGLISKYPELGSDSFSFLTPDSTLHNICDKNSMHCSFMYQTFEEFIQKNNTPTHYKLDGHFNDVGTALAAGFLTQEVENYLTNK